MQIESRYILLLLIPLGFLLRDERAMRLEYINGKLVWRVRPYLAFLVFAPVFLMAVFNRPHGDVNAYLRSYISFVPSNISEAIPYIASSKEPGFAAFNCLLKILFGANGTVFRFATALVHSIPIVLVFRRYSEDYVYSVFLFVALGLHLSWMQNGLRQFIAVTLIFAATPWMIRQETVKTIFMVLFASLFHRTALFLIPCIIISRGESWNWKTLLLILLTTIATFFFSKRSDLFDSFANSVGYSLQTVKEEGDDGTNPIRVLVFAVPMILSLVFREGLKKDNDPVVNLCVNMSIITTGIYMVSIVTSGIMVGRMPIYSSMYTLILMPYIIHHCFSEKAKKIVFLGAIPFYCMFLYIAAGGL